MGYLINSGTGFLSNAVTTVSNVKSYLVNKTGYLVDVIRIGIGDFGQRVLDDGGTLEASADAAASYREITKDIYDQASLVLFPSGYKDNLLYSHKPVNGSGDFTYTRGTDTATRVGADGYIKKERANLLVQSNQFDTTWSKTNTTPISGQSGYDGTNDAWKIEANTASTTTITQGANISGVMTASIYAKAGTTDWFRFSLNDSGVNTRAWFDLTNGVVGNVYGNMISTDIQNVGNGWYRCSITFNTTAANLLLFLADANSSISPSAGDYIYIQDAQLEEGLVATTPYIETTTAPVYEGLTDNLPRIDYTGGTPSILLEPSRQNRLPNSEYFGDWTNTSASFVYNVSNSPQGVKNAIRIIPNSSDFEIKAPVNTAVVSTESTFSVFLKYETGGFEYAVLGSGAPIQRYVFNIAEGTKVGSIGSTSIPDEKASIENYGNGWYRCVVTTNNTGGNKHSIYLSDDGTDIAATGADGTKGMLAWGAQAERENNYATSYIPTYGSSATRAADTALKGGFISSGITTSSNFTFYIEIEGLGHSGNPQIYLEDISGNRILSLNLIGQKNRYGFYSPDASNYITSIYNEADGVVKIAVTYDGTDFKEYFNGEEQGTLAASVAVNIDEIDFTKLSSNSIAVHQAILIPTALSVDDCEALTAL